MGDPAQTFTQKISKISVEVIAEQTSLQEILKISKCDLIDTLQPTIFESWEKGEVIRVYQGDY